MEFFGESPGMSRKYSMIDAQTRKERVRVR
jgi:hypothetical protein